MDKELQIKVAKVKVQDVPKYYLPNKDPGQNVPNLVAEHFQTVDMAHIRQLNGTENVSNSEGHRVVEVPQDGVGDEPGKPPGMHLQSFTIHRGHGPIVNLTSPPTEEDLKLLPSVQDKNGRIKRPMNAFFVWARIHRSALQKALPLTGSQDINIQLGRVWSELSDEQKSPYFEAAHKLRVLHNHQFPDYEYQPKKRKCKEQSTTGQRATLGEGQQQAFNNPSNVLQAMPLTQPTLSDVRMNAYPVMVPYMMYNHPYSFAPCHQIHHSPTSQIHSPRFFSTPTIHQALHGGPEYSSLHSPAGGDVYSGCLQQDTMQLRHFPAWSPY